MAKWKWGGGEPRTDQSEQEAERQTEKSDLNIHLATEEVKEKKKISRTTTEEQPTGPAVEGKTMPSDDTDQFRMSSHKRSRIRERSSAFPPDRRIAALVAVTETERSGATASPEEQGNPDDTMGTAERIRTRPPKTKKREHAQERKAKQESKREAEKEKRRLQQAKRGIEEPEKKHAKEQGKKRRYKKTPPTQGNGETKETARNATRGESIGGTSRRDR